MTGRKHTKARRRRKHTKARRRRKHTKAGVGTMALARVEGNGAAAPGALARVTERDVQHCVAAMLATKAHGEQVKPLMDVQTPPHHIKVLPKEAGDKAGAAYVTDDYLGGLLNSIFGPLGWGFELDWPPAELSQTLAGGGILMCKGSLSVLGPAGWVKKEAFGVGEVHKYRNDPNKIVKPDMGGKGMGTDAFKKCCDRLGLAQDVYTAKHPKVRQEIQRAEKQQQEAQKKMESELEPHQKEVTDLTAKIKAANLATAEQIMAAISANLPDKAWKAGVPNPRELTKSDVETLKRFFIPVKDGVARILDDGRVVARS